MRTLIALGLLVAASGTAAADGPRLVSYGDGGVRIGDVTVVHAKVDDAALDRAQDLLWFESGGTLMVIDLRVADGKSIAVAKKLPGGGFAIDGVSTVDSDQSYRVGHVAELSFGKRPAIRDGGYGYPMFDEGERKKQTRAFRKELAKATVTGKRWLLSQVGRKPHDVVTYKAEERPLVKVSDTLMGQCEDGGCGTAATFGDTPFETITSGQACGDSGCGVGYALYDPATRRFLTIGVSGPWGGEPTEWGESGPFQFAGDGKRYLTSKAVCTVGTTQTCTSEEGWHYLGWVP